MRLEGVGPVAPLAVATGRSSRFLAAISEWYSCQMLPGTAKFDVETEDGPSPRPRQWHPMQAAAFPDLRLRLQRFPTR